MKKKQKKVEAVVQSDDDSFLEACIAENKELMDK